MKFSKSLRGGMMENDNDKKNEYEIVLRNALIDIKTLSAKVSREL